MTVGRRVAVAVFSGVLVGLPIIAGAVADESPQQTERSPFVASFTASSGDATNALINQTYGLRMRPSSTFYRQTLAQVTEPRKFEVASVRLNTSVGSGVTGLEFFPGGRVSATRFPVALLIAAAYDVSVREILWSEKPLMAAQVDIEARAGANALSADAGEAARKRELRLMLQSLLAERFELAMHTETREMPVFALVTAKGGPRLKRSPSDRDCPEKPCGQVGGGPASGLRGREAEIGALAETLSLFLDRHVVDRTGLQGRYDIDVSAWASRDTITGRPVTAPSDPSLFTLIEDELGLKLEATRGARTVYVVDRLAAPSPD